MLTIFGPHTKPSRGPFPLVQFFAMPMLIAGFCVWLVRSGAAISTAVFAWILASGTICGLIVRSWLVGAGVNPQVTRRTFPWRYFLKGNATLLVVLVLCALGGVSLQSIEIVAVFVAGGGNVMLVLDWLWYSSRCRTPGGSSEGPSAHGAPKGGG